MTFSRLQSRQAFTMIEIAICLAVIGFALVAIIGVLPSGIQVQKDNREETLINQDAAFFMEAIRSGSTNADDLVDYMIQISLVETNPTPQANPNLRDNILPCNVSSGARIIGALSRPVRTEGMLMSDVTGLSFEPPWELVRVEAIVRALSGAAVEKGPQDSDPKKRTITFEYLMQVQVVPLDSSDPGLGNQIRGTLHTNLHDVRLTFRWPLLPDGKTGNNKKSFRSLVSGTLAQQGTNGFFFRPEKYY